MKKSVFIVILATLTACGGEELGECGRGILPYNLELTIVGNPSTPGQEMPLVVLGTDGQCQTLEPGTLVHVFVNGYGLGFPRNGGADKIDLVYTATSAYTVLTGAVSGWGVVHATVRIDGMLIEAEPVRVTVK